MERDFLGLRSMKPLAAIKQEITEEEIPCPSMSGACHDDRMNHMVSDCSKRGKKSSTADIQDFPSAMIDSPVNPSFASSGQNVLDAIMRPQFQGAPAMANSAVGSDLKPSAVPGQMTIFYAGSVDVYDGITPELAQAIMLLAGNASSLASSMKHPTSPADKAPSTAVDGVISQPTGNDGAVVIRTAVVKHENVALGVSIPMLATAMLPSAVPQFRKASLARFLEKRKERVMSSAPYSSLETKRGGGIVADNGSMVCALSSAGTSAAAV